MDRTNFESSAPPDGARGDLTGVGPNSKIRDQLDAALEYAARGWPVFPVGLKKHPLTRHGKNDATTDLTIIREWWQRWPAALISIPTGQVSGVVVLDIDVRETYSGLDTLTQLGLVLPIKTPTAHTPNGGLHLYFRQPCHLVPTSQTALGKGVEVKGEKGQIILPPGPGRAWDADFPLDGLDMLLWPDALSELLKRCEPDSGTRYQSRFACIRSSSYGLKALSSACKCIANAPDGEQEATLSREAFSMGGLVAGRLLDEREAVTRLIDAGMQMRSHDPRRPWTPSDVRRKVLLKLADGMKRPRHKGMGGNRA